MSELRATYWREGLLLAGFLVIVALSIVTVALPELSDTPPPDDTQTTPPADAGL